MLIELLHDTAISIKLVNILWLRRLGNEAEREPKSGQIVESDRGSYSRISNCLREVDFTSTPEN